VHNNKKLSFKVDMKTNHFQLGGTLIIDYKGNILLQHSDKFAGDHIKETDMIELLNEYYNEED
jgi:hypothetical protein